MYVELHCHSTFSFLGGASLPEDLAAEARRLGYSALALTDHNGLYGAMAFAHSAQSLGLQAITGAEVTLANGARRDSGNPPRGTTASRWRTPKRRKLRKPALTCSKSCGAMPVATASRRH